LDFEQSDELCLADEYLPQVNGLEKYGTLTMLVRQILANSVFGFLLYAPLQGLFWTRKG